MTAMMQCSVPGDVANVATTCGIISFSRTLVLVILVLTFNQHQSLTFYLVTNQDFLSFHECYMSHPSATQFYDTKSQYEKIKLFTPTKLDIKLYFIFIVPCIITFYEITNRCNCMQSILFHC